MSKVLEAAGIHKSYPTPEGEVTVLRNLNFHANRNEFVSFVGPSGCGKSTLFNIITGLLMPDSGSILLKNRETTGTPSPELGYVLQKDLLFPWRTVIDNVILGLEVRGMPKAQARAKARELFELYKMTGYEQNYPSQLSGGMKQRVALMRTMVTNPEIILMDEAYKALDYPLKISLESELLSVVKEQHKTVIFITHDIEEAVTLSDRVYVMKARPGEIVQEIEVDLGTESLSIPERRLSPRFNEYYEHIWRSIGIQPEPVNKREDDMTMNSVSTRPTVAATANRSSRETFFRSANARRYTLLFLQVAIVVVLLGGWELGVRSGNINAFLFSSPSQVWEVLVQRFQSGEMVTDVRVTAVETLVGFAVGAIGGSILGLLLWYSRFISDLAAPFIAAIGSIPVLAIAPMTIIWFGTEMLSKVVIVAFSCVVVSLTTSYKGAMRTDPDLINLLRSFNAGRGTIFFKLVVPSAMLWVLSGLRLNVGFALVGAIVGEYISSDSGVGHMILLGSSNFGMNIVLAGIVLVMLMMLCFNALVAFIERLILSWDRK